MKTGFGIKLDRKNLDLIVALGEAEEVHRPDVTIYIDKEDENERYVTAIVGALHGQQKRYVEMTATEARNLATLLNGAADEADAA